MKIKNREQALALVAVAALALFLSDRLIFTPLTQSWKTRGDRVATLRQDLSQGALLVQREQVIRTRWAEMRTNTLPRNPSDAESAVLKAFDRWAQDSRISVNSRKLQWKKNSDNYMTLLCRADTSGNLQAISRFLYDIESDPLALRIENIQIAARDKNGQQLSLGLQLSGLLLTPQSP